MSMHTLSPARRGPMRSGSVNTVDLSRPISHSFESSPATTTKATASTPSPAAKRHSGISQAHGWWANLAQVDESDAGKDHIDECETGDYELRTLPMRRGLADSEALGKARVPVELTHAYRGIGPEHSSGGPDTRSVLPMRQYDGSVNGAHSDRLSGASAQDVADPELDQNDSGGSEGRGGGSGKDAMHEAPKKGVVVFYTVSYLVFFSIMGTLARLGLQALTNYASAPVHAVSVWSNFAGCFAMGFLVEDRVLFHLSEVGDSPENSYKTQSARKKTLPLYVGLTTGFCGSFTTFSSFTRDTFLAMANDLSPNELRSAQSPGRSFLAVMAMIVTTVSLAFAGFLLGRNIALALDSAVRQRSRYRLPYKLLDHAAPVIALGAWTAAIIIASLNMPSSWPGLKVVTALAFAPVGCLLRFLLSKYLNGRWHIPFGTLAANVLGCCVIAAAWISSHMAGTGGVSVVGCILLTSGVEDGFCGCLTTVSTWVAELSLLRRRAAFVYGIISVAVCFGCVVAIAAPVRWGDRYQQPVC